MKWIISGIIGGELIPIGEVPAGSRLNALSVRWLSRCAIRGVEVRDKQTGAVIKPV